MADRDDDQYDEAVEYDDDPPSLPRLLASLALGARSVGSLPLAREEKKEKKNELGGRARCNEDDDDDGEYDDDEFSFRMSLPEFAALNADARTSLSSLLCRALRGVSRYSGDDDDVDDGGNSNENDGDDVDVDRQNDDTSYQFDDPELWEKCADACDALYDRVSYYIASASSRAADDDDDDAGMSALSAMANASRMARMNARGSHMRMTSALVDMERPQDVYMGFLSRPVQNDRSSPFVPNISHDDVKRRGVDDGTYRREGHGLDRRDGSSLGGGGGGGDDANDGGGQDLTRRRYTADMIAPSYHFDHPYREEIESLEYRKWQLDVSELVSKNPEEIARDNNNHDGKGGEGEDEDGVWISTEDDLARLVARIYDDEDDEDDGGSEGEGGCGGSREIALDLEAHSHRTFAGYVCLIQLSIRRPGTNGSASSPTPEKDDGGGDGGSCEGRPSTSPKTIKRSSDVSTGYDFLIDALALRHVIPQYLGPILSDPDVVKVMHGADSDVPWLQRDFGCYVVNLFDTGRAARALKFPSAGLAYLLRKYVGFDSDKSHQLSDWRRRPLPDDMRSYAVSDTRYLLDVYDQLRLELVRRSSTSVGGDVSIESVLDRSKRVCLIRYDKEPFRPMGYLTIMDGNRNGGRGRGRVASELSSQQEAALRSLYDWRDVTARAEDESVHYVCPNPALLRIASNRPATVAALQRLVNPLPPLVMRRSQEILDAIRESTTTSSSTPGDAAKEGTKDSPSKRATTVASKPNVPVPTPSRNREMLSPILGSEALYEQAGWMSDSDDDERERNFLEVDAANEGYSSILCSSHSIVLSSPSLEVKSTAIVEEVGGTNKPLHRGASTDGLGTARAAVGSASIDEEIKVAKSSASFVRKELTKLNELGTTAKFVRGFSLIDLIRPIPQSEDVDFDRDQDDGDSAGDDKQVNDDASVDDNPEEDEMVIPRSMREIYNLSNANRRTGKEISISKLLRLPEHGTEEVEAFKEDDVQVAEAIIASRGGGKRQRTPPGKEGDIKLMIKMGWVKDKKDAESLAIVHGCPQPPEKEGRHHGQQQKKPNTAGGGGAGGKGGGTFDYYSSMGAGAGAFDPNAMPSKNPFFAGAAMSAASMLQGGEARGKSHKRNKKR
jgi:ribonuclease D